MSRAGSGAPDASGETGPPAGESGGRESAFGVLGVAAGLGLLAALVLALAGSRGASLDGREVVFEVFEERELPFGVEIGEAAALPGGDRIVRLDAGAPEDWPAGDSPPPTELVLGVFRGEANLSALFRAGGDVQHQLRSWREGEGGAFRAVLEAGELEWGGWRAPFVRERAFLHGGTWRDTVRVNLSRGRRFAALSAKWPPEVEADEGHVARLLADLRLRPSRS